MADARDWLAAQIRGLRRGGAEVVAEVSELLVPRFCAGCDEPGVSLCTQCQMVLRRPPAQVTTREEVGCPVWSQNLWNGVARRLVVHAKERNRADLYPYLGASLGAAVQRLIRLGHLPDQVVLVPAPTTRSAARRRGGDHMTRICAETGLPVSPCLHYRLALLDAVELKATQRRERLRGAVQVTGAPPQHLLLIDDVVTTGATLAASHAALIDASRGNALPTRVWGALTFCAA